MQSENLLLRVATSGDLADIQSLFTGTISATCNKDYTPEQLTMWSDDSIDTQQWIQKLENQYFLVAMNDCNLVGFASLDNMQSVDMLYVEKNNLRKGIAFKLIQKLEAEAKKRLAKLIHANVSITAKPFFEKQGFTVLSRQISRREHVEIVHFNMEKEIF